MMADDSDPQYLWRMHDYLSNQQRETDQKYDYRYSVLIDVFGRLLSESRPAVDAPELRPWSDREFPV